MVISFAIRDCLQVEPCKVSRKVTTLFRSLPAYVTSKLYVVITILKANLLQKTS